MPPWGNRSKPKPAQRPRGEIESAASKKINDAVANVAAKHTDPSRGGRYGHQGTSAFLGTHGGQRPGQPAATNIPNRGGRMDPGQRAAATQADTRRAQTQALVESAAKSSQMDPGQRTAATRAAAQGRAPSMWGPNQQMPTTPEGVEAMKMGQLREWLATDDAKRFLGGADTPAPAVVDTTPGAPGIPDFGTDTTPAVTQPADTTPAVTTPAVTQPAVTTPAVTQPTVTQTPPPVGAPPVAVDPYASAINLGGVDTPYRRPEDLAQQIRDLMGERTTKDYSQDIKDLISERRTGLTDAEALRMGQIGDIETQLGTDIGALETDRLAQQQAMIDAIAGRASGLTGGIEDRLTAAREALGPQVTDEFEQVAQLLGGLGGSQAASSQDAMSRLAQVANMAAAERGAAPAQLAAEAELALGDEAFRMFQGLDQEQTQRLMDESMRQEAFNTRRDEDMVNALLGDVGRREDFLTRETERQQGMDYGRGERIEGQDWRTDERESAQRYGTAEREAGQTWQGDQATAERDWREEAATMAYARSKAAAKDERDWREGESALDRAMRVSESAESSRQRGLDRKAQKDAATKAFDRSQQQIREAHTHEDKVRFKQESAEAAAAAAITQGSASAAEMFLGIGGAEGAAMWDALPESAKTQMYKDKVAAEDTQGARWQPGSYANMVGKYGEANSDHILHAEHMVGMPEKQREEYLASLSAVDAMGNQAMDASDIEKINLFAAEIDAANATVQAANRITAREAAGGAGARGTGVRKGQPLPKRGDLAAPAGASMRPETPGFGPNVDYSKIGPGGY